MFSCASVKPRCTAITCRMPAFRKRSILPSQSRRSGIIGFLTSTVKSDPRTASAICCTSVGFTHVRAPTHTVRMPYAAHSSNWRALITSTQAGTPYVRCTSCNHGRASSPAPQKLPGTLRTFQMPARKQSRRTPTSADCSISSAAVASSCSRLSAAQGPAIQIRSIIPRFPILFPFLPQYP